MDALLNHPASLALVPVIGVATSAIKRAMQGSQWAKLVAPLAALCVGALAGLIPGWLPGATAPERMVSGLLIGASTIAGYDAIKGAKAAKAGA